MAMTPAELALRKRETDRIVAKITRLQEEHPHAMIESIVGTLVGEIAEERVRRLLDAAGPVIWREAHEIDRSWSDAISEGIGLVGREMCAECDAFLGKEHRIGCSKSGQVSTTEAVEKFTTVAHANAEEPMLGLDAEAVALIIEALPDPDDPEVAEDWDPDQAPQQAEKLKALGR
jgi:uncharacterized protein (DUF697 family)